MSANLKAVSKSGPYAWIMLVALMIALVVAGQTLIPAYIDHRIDNYISNNRIKISGLIGQSRGTTSLHPIKLSDEDARLVNQGGIHTSNRPAAASHTIVIFSDYLCAYCKAADASMSSKFLSEKSKSNLVFYEFPILSKDSSDLAELAVAANTVGLYNEFRQSMMKIARPNARDGIAFLERRGMKMAYIEKLRKSAGVAKTLQASKEMARKLGISATPAIIIDGTLVAGWNEKEIQKLLS